jgi:hypothetical protein
VKGGIEARLKRGESPRQEMIFEPDQAVKPFSLGAKGAWAIAAQGANPIHAFVHFDGSALWVISTSAGSPASLDGHPVPHTWVVAPVPSVLSFGEAEIVIAAASEEPQTDLIARRAPPSRPPLKISEETMVAPVSLPWRSKPPPPPPFAALRSAPPPPPLISPRLGLKDESLMRAVLPRLPGKGTPVLPSPVLGAVARPKQTGPFAVWRKLPARRRALVVLFPIALLTVALQAKKQSRGIAASPSAAVASADSAARVVASTESPLSLAPSAATTASSFEASRMPGAGAAPAASASGASAQGKSLERKAADAVVAGDEARAIALYAELSKEYPERAEFGQARAILLRRAQLGDPAAPRQ